MQVSVALVYVVLFFIGLRFVVALVNYFVPLNLKSGIVMDNFRVSVLIPARNEANNIRRVLSDLQQQSYHNMEVLVYDDQSDDETATIVAQMAKHDANIHLLHGSELPDGWTGKNYACHQLSQNLQSDVYIYLDADVHVSPDFVERAVSHLKSNRLTLLSIFPVQTMYSLGERVVVPLMNWILLSLLPLPLVRFSKRVSMSAANGQCMVFDGHVYREKQWHALVRNQMVEDISIAREVKRNNLRMATLLGFNDVSCRMYDSFATSFRGLSRSAPAFFGQNLVFAMFFIFLVIVLPLVVFLFGELWQVLVYVTGVLFLRILVALSSRQPVFEALILHVPQMILFPAVLLNGFFRLYTKKHVWKNRVVKL